MLQASQGRCVLATVFFAASTSFRANGVLNAGFVLWYLVWRADYGKAIQVGGFTTELYRAYSALENAIEHHFGGFPVVSDSGTFLTARASGLSQLL